MRGLIAALFLGVLVAGGCEGPTQPPVEEVATEAFSDLTDEEVRELEAQARLGDRMATDALINHFGLNEGDDSERMIYWQLQAVRGGSCRWWLELMFVTLEDGGRIPPAFLAQGETLEAIGEAHGCGPYQRLKDLPPDQRRAWFPRD